MIPHPAADRTKFSPAPRNSPLQPLSSTSASTALPGDRYSLAPPCDAPGTHIWIDAFAVASGNSAVEIPAPSNPPPAKSHTHRGAQGIASAARSLAPPRNPKNAAFDSTFRSAIVCQPRYNSPGPLFFRIHAPTARVPARDGTGLFATGMLILARHGHCCCYCQGLTRGTDGKGASDGGSGIEELPLALDGIDTVPWKPWIQLRVSDRMAWMELPTAYGGRLPLISARPPV